MNKIIIKVQRPIASTDGRSPIYVYDESRSLELFIYPQQKLYIELLDLMGESFKKFFEIEGFSISGAESGEFKVLGEAPWQEW